MRRALSTLFKRMENKEKTSTFGPVGVVFIPETSSSSTKHFLTSRKVELSTPVTLNASSAGGSTQTVPLASGTKSKSMSNLKFISFSSLKEYYVQPTSELNERLVVLSGSFNPLHIGHVTLLNQAMQTAEKYLLQQQQQPGKEKEKKVEQEDGSRKKINIRGIFEIAIDNVDKGLIREDELLARIGQFNEGQVVIESIEKKDTQEPKAKTSTTATSIAGIAITQCPYFASKASIFPRKSFFVVGADTAKRIVDTKYCKDPVASLKHFQEHQTIFLVAARNGLTWEAIQKSKEYQTHFAQLGWGKLFHAIEDWKEMSISSTEIREQKKSRHEKKNQEENNKEHD
eukprot:g3419.t1